MLTVVFDQVVAQQQKQHNTTTYRLYQTCCLRHLPL
jgi:hypothetical protein